MSNTSIELFVRGKYQLARYEPGSAATGRRLTLHEVLEAYGEQVLPEIDEYLSAVLLRSNDAIENALRTQRRQLGGTREQLASAANVPLGVVDAAETFVDEVTIRDLEHLAFVLGLDPAQLSFQERAGADPELGVRLRVLTRDESTPAETRLSPRTVLRFSEAASVIVAQSRLQDWLNKPREADRFEPSSNFGPPAWSAGYDLATQAREQLGIGLSPIRSMRELVEDRLGIPVVQVELPPAIAGATISVSNRRGIVLNTVGANTNVWIRRTTLAHELAHLLFDPEARLASVRVDSYEQMQRNTEDTTAGSQDDVEQRANAFAVEFLAPRVAVKQMVPNLAHVGAEAIGNVMSEFGIGRAAARFHVANAWWRQVELPSESSIRATPTDEQRAAEDFTQDFFPIVGTPAQRRGRFALLTAEAVEAGLITADTSAQYLACSEEEFEKALPYLLDLA
ncbi:MAG: ImmA/IrrE family metallo-endopeptidase [bacterium]|nr:ImmA/IrrE family metallo-endopeptidase [bacterium]